MGEFYGGNIMRICGLLKGEKFPSDLVFVNWKLCLCLHYPINKTSTYFCME